MTSDNTDVTAEQYRQLAERVREADDETVWNAFGRDMMEMATSSDRAPEFPFAGFVMAVRDGWLDGSLDDILFPRHYQLGDSRDGLKGNAVAQKADVYAVYSVNARNQIDATRGAVGDALDRAAGGDDGE